MQGWRVEMEDAHTIIETIGKCEGDSASHPFPFYLLADVLAEDGLHVHPNLYIIMECRIAIVDWVLVYHHHHHHLLQMVTILWGWCSASIVFNPSCVCTCSSFHTDPELAGHSFVAVYDGHGGQFSAIYCGNHMIESLRKTQGYLEYKK